MEFRDLTIKDMEGIEIKSKNMFDVLAATAERAKEILQNQEAVQRQPRNMFKTAYPERKSEISVRIADEEGEGFLAAAAKKKKCNVPNSKKKIMDNGPQPPPPLPEEFKKVIQEMAQGKDISQETLVIQKALFDTDLSKNHNRISIPITRISHDFLTEEEKNLLCTQDKNNKKKYIELKIIEPSLEREIVKFSRWDMPKKSGKTSSSYVINGTWNHIVHRNALGLGTVVQLWGFRIGEELCFALVRLPKRPTQRPKLMDSVVFVFGSN